MAVKESAVSGRPPDACASGSQPEEQCKEGPIFDLEICFLDACEPSPTQRASPKPIASVEQLEASLATFATSLDSKDVAEHLVELLQNSLPNEGVRELHQVLDGAEVGLLVVDMQCDGGVPPFGLVGCGRLV